MRSEKLFRPFIRPMFNSHCGGIRLDEVSLMKRIGALLLCGIPGCSMSRQGSPLRMRSALSLMCLKRMP